jgi:putative hydrolase of the HAD superfamily
LDNTLLDPSRFRESIVRTCEMLASERPGLDVSGLLAANTEAWRDYWPEIEDPWTLGEVDGATVSLEAWRRTLRVYGRDDESLARLAVQAHAQTMADAHRLFDDVRELFTATTTARIPVALITNGASDTQRHKLEVLGISAWFDVVVISGEAGVAKPDPLVFASALDQLAVAPQNTWHVGDSLESDVAGAKGAGLTAVWLNREGATRRDDDPEPDLEIRSLSSLLPALGAK